MPVEKSGFASGFDGRFVNGIDELRLTGDRAEKWFFRF
jgi:hypothetical protein